MDKHADHDPDVWSAAGVDAAVRWRASLLSPPLSQGIKLKVLHVITDLAIGGAEMQLCTMLEEGTEGGAGITHAVVSLMKGGALQGRIRAAGIEVEEIGLARGAISVTGAWRLADTIQRQRPDIIQGWMYHGNLAATVAKALQRRSCPLVWGIHYCPGTLREDKRRTRIVIRSGGPLSRIPAAIVYCANESAQQHHRLGYRIDRTVVISNGFDTETFKPDPEAKARLAAELGVARSAPLVGVVGRFHAQKDHANILAAAALLRERAGAAHLVLVGPNLDRKNTKLMATIAAHGLREHVTLLGTRHDIAKIMPGFDLLCSGSAYGEAFPIVLGEAMASGVPCVATDVGDSSFLVGDTGVIVPPRDPQALAEGLRQLIELGSEGRRRLSRAARQRIIEQFSVAQAVRRYEGLYRRLYRP